MATKTKTTGTTISAPAKTLEGMFSDALALVEQKHDDKALVALEAVQAEAGRQERLDLVRSAGCYVKALQARHRKEDGTPVNPELAAQLSLNRGAADEALELLDRVLKTQSQDGRLFYLKATAHAQKNETEAAAEALHQAVALNQDFLHQFRLEQDFDRIRSTAPFLTLGLE